MHGVTRVYTSTVGKRAHFLPPDESPNSFTKAFCGVMCWPYLWMGTGTEDERARALSLQVCMTCERVMSRLEEEERVRKEREDARIKEAREQALSGLNYLDWIYNEE